MLLGIRLNSWNACLHKDLHTDIYGFLHNCQSFEATQMSFRRWVDHVVHAGNGTLFSTKKKWPVKPWKDMEETYMHITKCKKPMWKGYVLYDSRSKCTCGVWDVSTYQWETVPVSGPEVYMGTLFSAQLCSEPKTSLKNNVYVNNKLYPKDEIKSNRTVPWIEDSHFAGWD